MGRVRRRLRASLTERGRQEARFDRLVQEGRVRMGRHSYAAPIVKTFANDATELVIGSYTSIGGDVTFILGGNHPMDRVTTFPLRERLELPGAGADGYPWSKGDIIVGNDVWIGFGATIVSGVTIGDGAVIGACSVVVGDVEPYTIVAGNPASLRGRRLAEEVADELLRIKWWDWPESQVRESVHALTSVSSPEILRALSGSYRRD